VKRRLFTFAAAGSLLLCTAVLILWPVSLGRESFCEHTAFSSYGKDWYWVNWQIWSEDGFLRWASTWVEVNTPNFDSTWDEQPGQWTLKSQLLGTSGPQMGFPANLRPQWDTATGVFGPTRPDVIRSRYVGIIIPYWCLLAVSLPLPVVWIFRHRRQTHRRKRSLCLTCGYDLTGNVSGTCPECGTPVPKAPADKSPFGKQGGVT